MMQKVELRLRTDASTASMIAMTAFLPEPSAASGCVILASPGGGYGRGYYDMHFPGHQGYSQAEHHVARGHLFIAYDHLGVGESSTERLDSLTIEDIADHNHAAIEEVLDRISRGILADSFPALPEATVIGIGQSMGGGVSIIMQARHLCFDAIGVLGYSAIHTVLPQRTEALVAQGVAAYDFDRGTSPAEMAMAQPAKSVADFVYPFHWEDVPADILDADMAGGYPLRRTTPPFGSLTIPPCVVAMMSRGYVRDEAAVIDVPVLLAFGERDVSPDPQAEPAAFPNAPDISLCVVPRMAHMHNFGSTRALLWDRISDWATDLSRAAKGK
jgi:pimeloyl-ACP methyl ester carboxylesterase